MGDRMHNVNKPLKKAAVYLRVSSEEQVERKTIENQLEFGRKYCDLHGLDTFEWYKDDGVTGTIPLDAREAGARVLDDARNSCFDLLLIYRLDRLGRSARIILNAVHELEEYGVKIRSMTEPFDTGDPNGRFLLTILAGVADLERETILERMWHGANRAAREGRWLGGIVPYGYRVDAEKRLEIVEEPLSGMEISEADVIRLIYRLIAGQGYSTIKVADYLNALGVPPSYTKDGRLVRTGKRYINTAGIWRPGRVYDIVTNTTYMGIHHYGKRATKERETITRAVPAIVSPEIWEKTQLVLKENRFEDGGKARRQYLLRSLIKCGNCGLTYHGTAYKGQGGKKAYYVCGGKTAYRGPYNGKCRSKNIPTLWIEDYVWQSCVSFIINPGDAIREMAAGMEEMKSQSADFAEEKELIQQAIHDKDKEKQSILDLYRKKIITSTDVEEQLGKIAAEKAELLDRVRSLDKQLSNEDMARQFDSAEALLIDLREKIKTDPPFSVRRQIVKALVKEIIVTTENDDNDRPRNKVTAKFTFSKDVTRTGALAGTLAIPGGSAFARLCRYSVICSGFRGPCWTVSTCI